MNQLLFVGSEPVPAASFKLLMRFVTDSSAVSESDSPSGLRSKLSGESWVASNSVTHPAWPHQDTQRTAAASQDDFRASREVCLSEYRSASRQVLARYTQSLCPLFAAKITFFDSCRGLSVLSVDCVSGLVQSSVGCKLISSHISFSLAGERLGLSSSTKAGEVHQQCQGHSSWQAAG